MNVARYSLLTIQPDPERIDVLCVGLIVRTAEGGWNVLTPGATKLACLGAQSAAQQLPRMSANLVEMLQEADSLDQARNLLRRLRSKLSLHDFEGVFSYEGDAEFSSQVGAIVSESVMPPAPTKDTKLAPATPAGRPRVRARLRRHFTDMGIIAKKDTPIQDRIVFPDFPVSLKHGLKAEFAIRHRHMIVTETVDFEVAEESHRHKNYEAQAKCLVMRAAQEHFGADTRRLIVVNGGAAAHALRSVDLLSTAGELFAVESAEDMDNYFGIIASAAGSTPPLAASTH